MDQAGLTSRHIDACRASNRNETGTADIVV